MKYIIISALLGFVLLLPTGCDLDLSNPNAATETDVFNTKDGLFALAIGTRQVFSVIALEAVIMTPSVTTRETAITTTFANLEELEEGGEQLSGENGYTNRLFNNVMRAKGMAENLVDNVDNVSLSAGTSSALKAWGGLFRAMCLGHLAHNYEKVAIRNSLNNDAAYSDRAAAYDEAISLLQNAVALLTANPPSAEFLSSVGADINLLNTCNAFLSRYQLMRGNYAAAIAAANAVDKSVASVFTYDGENGNPLYGAMFVGTVEYFPRDNFGLPAGLEPDAGDLRVPFFVEVVDKSSLNVLPIDNPVAPFWQSLTSDLPVYRPGEMLLNIAEAHARSGNLVEAENALNQLRQKTPAQDVFGIGGGLTDTYSSGGNQNALLAEIYKNRRIELHLIGTSLEDSRRFNRPEPPTGVNLNTERNRNFYPYPSVEHLANTNTPADPSI
jgi:tetratricopeptide (TPR) repeat protein